MSRKKKVSEDDILEFLNSEIALDDFLNFDEEQFWKDMAASSERILSELSRSNDETKES